METSDILKIKTPDLSFFPFDFWNEKQRLVNFSSRSHLLLNRVDGFKEDEKLWHFHPLAFVQHLKRIFDNPSGVQIRKVILEKLKTYSWGSTSIIGDAKLIMGSGIDTNDINMTKDKTFEVLYDLVGKNSITEVTLSSLYRTPTQSANIQGSSSTSPHTGGRGIDVTKVVSTDEFGTTSEVFDNRNRNNMIEKPLITQVTNWAKNDDRISQVLTPWRMISGGSDIPNKWLEDETFVDGFHYPHRHHMHLTIIP